MVFLAKIISDAPYKKQLPSIPEESTMTELVKDQIITASGKARHHPTALNLGNLGMVYQADAFYEKAFKCYALAVKRNKSDWLWNYYLGYLYLEMGTLIHLKRLNYTRNVTVWMVL